MDTEQNVDHILNEEAASTRDAAQAAMKHASPKTGFSDDTIAAVLGRAAQIDAQGRSVTQQDLMEWAGEAGISPAAVQAALLEMDAPPQPRLKRYTQAIVAFAAGAAGFIAGAFVRIVADDPLVFDRGMNAISPVAVAVATISTIAMSRSRAVRDRFQILNALVWGCYISGWSIANGVATESIMLLGIAAGIVTSIAGGVVTHVMNRRHTEADEHERVD